MRGAHGPWLDHAKPGGPQAVQAYQTMRDAVPLPDWRANINAHYQSAVRVMRGAALEAVGMAPARPRGPFLSDAAFLLLRARRQIRKSLHMFRFRRPQPAT